MRIWLISFGLLFGAVELYEWFAALNIPMPIYIACGVALAIASNTSKLTEQIYLPQNDNFVNPPTEIKSEVRAIASSPSQPLSFKIERPTWQQKSEPIDESRAHP